jgi:hypothetical protein
LHRRHGGLRLGALLSARTAGNGSRGPPDVAGIRAPLMVRPEGALSPVVLAYHLEAIEASIAALDQEIATVHAQNPVSRLLAGITGIGKRAASAIVARVPDRKFSSRGTTFPPGSDRRRAKIPAGQREARLHQQTGQPLHEAAARAGRDLVAARGWQAERRVARLAGPASRAQTRVTGHGGARQQARADHMGRFDGG